MYVEIKKISFIKDLIVIYRDGGISQKITLNYMENINEIYLLRKNGVFIEQHEFIQAITPIDKMCGGYAISGKMCNNKLELIGFKIPYGYTLLVEPYALHGDSSLICIYSMATVDTVLIKNNKTFNNVQFNISKSEYKTDKLLLSSNEKTINEIKKIDNKMKDNIYNKLDIFHKIKK